LKNKYDSDELTDNGVVILFRMRQLRLVRFTAAVRQVPRIV